MPELLRVAEVAKITGLAERTIRRLIAQNRLRAVRPEGLRVVLIPRNELASLWERMQEKDAGGSTSS